MKHLLSVTAAAILAAICLFSCEREIMPPITGVSFQMDSVFFYGSDPELVIRSKSKGVEATLSITVDGTDAFCNGEPYAIGEDGCDTIRIDTGLGVGEHTVRALALGCCGRYIQEDFTFRVLPSLEAASTNIFQTGIPVQPLILRMEPASYIGQTTVKEADDAVLQDLDELLRACELVGDELVLLAQLLGIQPADVLSHAFEEVFHGART